MKSILKFLISLSLLLGLFACSSLPTEEDSSSSIKSSVQFTMQSITNSANSNILFSSTESETPSKVAISYKKSGENEEVISTTIELTAFGSSYITDDVLSLYEGNYEVTKLDVLNDEGTTIYSTPVSGSDIAINLNITTALAYSFEVKEGEISTEKMGKKKVIAETGAGQHGVALATVAALFGIECDIYMGEIDIAKEYPNVIRMKILGANVIPVSVGGKSLKEAVDVAFQAYLKDPVNQLYAIGSVVGPHPFPMMVRDFQSIVGREAKEQFREMTNTLPDNVIACVGGGSNAMGIFSAFFNEEKVKLYGVEPAGISFKDGEHAATLTKGSKGIIHGFKCYLLQDEKGNPLPVHSIASGLDYPGVGPEHCHLKDLKKVNYESVNDKEAISAFFEISREEGIIPALESSHAVAYALKLAPTLPKEQTILVNLSGRGDKDIDYVVETYGKEFGII